MARAARRPLGEHDELFRAGARDRLATRRTRRRRRQRRQPDLVGDPCHRAIGAAGALTGYAGGLERKRWLLRHEGAL
ncbi:MAG: MGMT family protein [Candidatus Binatia bacterium]